MLPKKNRVLSRVVASPTTYGTFLMRVNLALIMVFSSVAVVLYVVALGTDQLYTLHNQENIYYTPNGSPVSTQTLLLPQLEATVGLVTACVGHNCFARAGRSGVQGLVATTLGSQSFTAGGATDLQTQLETEFMFGYDGGMQCGMPATKIQRVAEFGYAAYVVSMIFFLGTCIAGMLFCQLVGDTDLLAGSPSLDGDSNAINVEELGLSGVYIMLKLRRHLSSEGPLLTSVLVLSGFAFVFGVCGMGVTLAVVLSTSKCGVSVCSSFESSMQQFFAELVRLNVAVSPTPQYSCHTGASFALSIVGVVLGLLCFLLACLLFGWFSCSRRRKDMLNLRDQLYRLADVQGLIGTIAGGGDTPFPLAQSRQVSAVAGAGTGSAALSLASAGRDPSGNIVAYHRGSSSVSVGAARPGSAVFSAVESTGLLTRSVGARIGLYRTLKQFASMEERARQGVDAEERVNFYGLLALRETLWYDGELRLLHAFTLNWFVGPPLDLCVLETNERQRIMEEYNASEQAFLQSITTGFDDREEPAQAWEKSGPLPVAEAARWSQQVAHWQEMQAAMAPQILRTASYSLAETQPPSPPPRRKNSALKLTTVMVPPTATAPSLETDRWLTILDKLRAATHDDGAFITRSASPLLVRRNTSAIANFDDDTSFSSNVFSDPSFAQTHCEDFTIPSDNVRTHLAKTAHLAKTLPRPPPRLLVLPQFDTKKKRTGGGKSGKRRRRHSSSSSGSGDGLASPQGRSPTTSPFIGGDETNSYGSVGDAKDDPLHATARPFSSRDGTSFGGSPFLTGLAVHNSNTPAVSSPNTRVGLVNGSGDASASTTVPSPNAQRSLNASPPVASSMGNSWRFPKAT